MELYVFSNLMSFSHLLSQRGISHVGASTAILYITFVVLQSCFLNSMLRIFYLSLGS